MDDRRDSDESSTDDEVYQGKREKTTSKQKKLEFESEETKQQWINSLEKILAIQSENPIMSKNQNLIKENDKLKKKLEDSIKKKKEDHQILNKDFIKPTFDKESQEKEAKLHSIALNGVISLFKTIQNAKLEQKKREEKETGYEVLEETLNPNKKQKMENLED